ncbi:PREDICTED: LOB domain-containing protein 31 [Tarenaya hassleriana]|uniref:LOB domain-containing protein 31 n=1 Tax=Tarenaya hassleriana TaxID=28532 RepID=UPI00053C46DD|nr:PREDICTED: LOB domain-containing protein 31 [Tarenaya hassleriana]
MSRPVLNGLNSGSLRTRLSSVWTLDAFTSEPDCLSVGSGSRDFVSGEACKYLRRKCVEGCVFAPYFDSEDGTSLFAAVHKVFGASNATKLLSPIPPSLRLDAILTLSYEATARVRDPVFGCVSHIFSLHQQVVNLQAELAYVQARLSAVQGLPPPPPAPEASSEADLLEEP